MTDTNDIADTKMDSETPPDSGAPEPTSESFHADLTRYLDLRAAAEGLKAQFEELRGRIKELDEERRALGARLGATMDVSGATSFELHSGDRPVSIRRARRVSVRYDEEALRGRLGDRYRKILSIDTKALRARKDEVREWLGEHLDEVGRPDRKRVKALIEAGEATVEDFAGAFEREVRYSVTVTPIKAEPEF